MSQSGEPEPKRRRSLFDFETSDAENTTHKFPDRENGISYPVEYLEKVKSEMSEWKLQLTKALEVKKSVKKTTFEFKNKVYDESVLSPEQLRFLSFDNYLERVNVFCNQLAIIHRKFNKQDQEEREYKMRFVDTQKKIEDDILPKV